MWIFAALITPICHGFANILDNYFAGHVFKRVTTVAYFSALFNFLLLPLILIISPPEFPTTRQFLFFGVIGIIDVIYLLPYYKALKLEDTSIVTSLFSIGQIFVPILAYFIVKEELTAYQYVGFSIIIISSALLSIDTRNKFKLSRSTVYMISVCLLLAFETVIYKYVFDDTNASWGTAVVWPSLFSFLGVSLLLLNKSCRIDIRLHIQSFKSQLALFAFQEFLTFIGAAAGTLAISLSPAVTLVDGVEALQPLFVMFYAIIFKRFWPSFFNERVDSISKRKKGLLFLLMTIGTFLTVMSKG